MRKLSIPAGGHVLVCDGGKALLLENAGSKVLPNLKTLWVSHSESRPSRELGTDRPGRSFESTGARRSAMEETDLQDQAEENFARALAERLDGLAAQGDLTSLVVVAAPRMLADLRRFFPPRVRGVVSEEIDKDLTHLPVREIEQRLTAQ